MMFVLFAFHHGGARALFMKYFFPHQPYGQLDMYIEKIMKASLERLARLIKVCGLLLQTKVYLFWEKSEGIN